MIRLIHCLVHPGNRIGANGLECGPRISYRRRRRRSPLNIRHKTTAVIFTVLSVLTACAMLIIGVQLLLDAKINETAETSRRAARVFIVIENMVSELERTTSDYAAWDDTRQFIEDSNDDYIHANLIDETFLHNRFGFMVFLDPQGKLVHGAGYDPEAGRATAPPPGLMDKLSPGSPLLRDNTTDPVSGILVIPEGSFLVSSYPILTSRFEGPSKGTLVIGQKLDTQIATLLARLTQLQPMLLSFADEQIPADVRSRLLASPTDNPVTVKNIDSRTIAGYALINDVLNQPALVLKVSGARTHFQRALRNLVLLCCLLLAVGAGAVAVSLSLINRLVLARTTQLSDFVNHISSTGDLAARVTLRGKDELSELGSAFNRMLDALEEDISDRKRAQEEIKKQETFLRSVIDTHPGFVFVKDRDSRFLLANETLCRMYGTTVAGIVGKSDADFNSNQEEVEHFHRDDLEVITTKSPKHIAEEKVTGADGQVRWVSTYKLPLLSKDGSCASLLGVTIDITAQKKAQEERQALETQMQQSQKLESLGVLAGGIAHDFNNLLMAVLGNADMALSSLPPNSPICETLEEIIKGARRAAELCKQMLAYSGKSQFIVEPQDLSAIVRDMSHMLEISVSKKALLRYNFAGNLPAVDADATQLRQIVMNLMINASESLGDKGGVIAVSTGTRECDMSYLLACFLGEKLQPGMYVYLDVTDTGAGMDRATLNRIFDPFFSTKFTGRGLGLTAVLGIIRGHHGAIRVDSEPGRGTSFRVLFPASVMGAVRKDHEPESAEWRGSGTILVVDDEETVRTLGQKMVERSGFTALTACDGQEAVDVFRRNADKIACVVLDLTMPNMDGVEAFHELRKIRGDVRVILSSGYDEQEVSRRFAGAGMAGFIEKPYTRASLVSVLRRVLEKPAAE